MQPSVNIQSPIDWSAPLNRGLLRWWLCLPNQNRGNVWRELTRKSDATVTGALVGGSLGRPGGFGCYRYDGTDDAAQTAAIDLSAVNQLTLSMWIFVGSYAANDLLLETSANANSNTAALQINLDDTGNWAQRIKTTSGNNTYRLASRPASNAWFHYMVCCDRTAGAQQIVSAYVNGVSQSLTMVFNDTDSAGGFGNYAWNFCSRNNASLYANVRLDDVRLYNRVVSAGESVELFRESKAGYPRLLRWIDSPLATFADQGVANSYWAWNQYGAVA